MAEPPPPLPARLRPLGTTELVHIENRIFHNLMDGYRSMRQTRLMDPRWDLMRDLMRGTGNAVSCGKYDCHYTVTTK